MQDFGGAAKNFRVTLNAGYALAANYDFRGQGENPITISVGGQSVTLTKAMPNFTFNAGSASRSVTITSKEYHEAATCDPMQRLSSDGSRLVIHYEDQDGTPASCMDPLLTLTAR